MKLIKVAAAVLNQTPRDWSGNFSNIVLAIDQAKSQQVSILCLPEMCITGYGMEDDLFCLDVTKRAMKRLFSIAKNTHGMIVSVGLPVMFNNSLFNVVATIVDGKVVGFRAKENLASDGIHYESRHFKPWPKNVVQNIVTEAGIIPIGDIHFDIGGVKIGYELCEEAWTANRPGTILASKAIDVYLNPSASHFAFGKINTRKNFVTDGSRAFGATYIYTNLLGNESGRAIFDGGALIATGGSLIAVGKRFSYNNVILTTAVIDIDNTRTSQIRTASFQPNLEEYDKNCVKVCGFEFPIVNEQITMEPDVETWELSENIKYEECTRALGLSLMDYMRKSHTNGFVISLSGGADSAMVTYLCVAGIRNAIKELGLDNFIKKYCPHLELLSIRSDNIVIKNLVTTAYQATENSGSITKNAACEIAKALNVKHYELNVQPVLDEYIKIAKIIKPNLNWKDDDITLQNLQARTRSPSIWLFANIESKLLLTTSNMSEAALGYTTADGDLSGCVAPIAGLPKVFIRKYLKHIENVGDCVELKYINNQAPTAELRPSQYKQTDEDDLMPYELLHKIEVLSMRNRYTPVEIYKYLIQNGEYDNNTLISNIVKFFTLFSRNQWKREKIPLSFHMDDHNLDPRSWARFPILNSGYKEELDELKTYLK